MSRTDVTQKIEKRKISDYRKIDRLSYSALKIYDNDRKKFYKKYILGQEDDDSDSDAARLGTIVDIIMTDPDNFDDYFVISSAEKPSGQLLKFVTFLFDITLKETKNGVVQSDMIDRMQKAYLVLREENGGKLRDKYETFVENFVAKGRSYYDELLESVGKMLITSEEMNLANSICDSIRSADCFNLNKGCKRLSKVVILFDYKDVEMKAEVDEIEIDDIKKIIYPFDYKVTAFVEDFLFSAFLKRGYYIQSSLYRFAIEQWKKENGYENYVVENLAFKVACQNNYYAPLLYRTSDRHYIQGFTGFYMGNTYYKGIDQLISEIDYSTENDVWNMSARNSFSNGIVYIPEFTE